MQPKPAVAESWEPSKDLQTWTFKLRRGAEYHNGQTIDAESVKWNIERIKDPKIGHAFTRSVLADVERVTVDDKHTVQFHLKEPHAALDINLIYYPVNLMAPGAVDTATRIRSIAAVQVQSRGADSASPSWCDWGLWETDRGQQLPYLDGLVGGPRRRTVPADRAAHRRARPDRQCRLCRRPGLQEDQSRRSTPGRCPRSARR
jgi:peptide/nickel transport system substrate-binding protein